MLVLAKKGASVALGLSFHSVPLVERLDLAEYESGKRHNVVVQMVGDGIGRPIVCPVVVVRGQQPGPVVGITAAVHGNELNGIDAIHALLKELDPQTLVGTVVAVPVVNVPGYLSNERTFNDRQDLNRLMPGKRQGTNAQVYAYRFMERIVSQFQYLIDLHTASTGRINSLYVRADLTHPETAWMARRQHPEIILHNRGVDGTLRGAAMSRGIPAITVEIGNPQMFQPSLINHGVDGLRSVLAKLEMIDAFDWGEAHEPVICARSSWMYTETGGVLKVFPKLRERLTKGQKVAEVTNIFGVLEDTYYAPDDGIVIGKAVNPVNQTGSRILHLGIIARDDELPEVRRKTGKLDPMPETAFEDGTS